ncbi:MAG: ATP-dependent helicase [Firmicutes bacterium HGW-Firmicutes-1]|jgi:DNA excision repair protein ERCC-2|nr:MAG: ATP-dependent helicase [Firmicutes bacterium HGW-Firmicutes-1]
MQQIKISVRELIEYVLRTGDINAVFLSSKRMSDGVKAHQRFQKQTKEDYEEEVTISLETECDETKILLSGRIDGVVHREGQIIIDEIKSTSRNLEDIEIGNSLHWAQVWMYAYMYAIKYDLKEVGTRLTYIELETYKIKQFEHMKTINELHKFFEEVMKKYIVWARKQNAFKEVSRETINNIEFPFGHYRKGQKKLMSSVYNAIEDKKVLFSRAPTGTGKTVATLFPAIKALGNQKCDKLFYLTAKTIGKEVVVDTLQLLELQGLLVKRVVITAKDKICTNDKKACNPEECIYAKGHYDRVNKVLEVMYAEHHLFDRETIVKYALEFLVCPYELSLDLALFSDIVVCDYNYVFDPSAVLKRFFIEDTGKYVLLIDEAHNLIDRARDMYSAVLDKQRVMSLKRKVKDLDQRLYKYFTLLNKGLLARKKLCSEYEAERYCEAEMPTDLEEAMRGIIFRTEKIFSLHKSWEHMNELLEFYFDSYDFIKKMELYDERYVTYYEETSKGLIVKLFCMDPSNNLKRMLEGMQGVVFFSATLLPMEYYVNMLGGDKKSYGLILDTPFSRNNLCLIVDQTISTKFVDREISIKPIVERILQITQPKRGNYMVFFPSYKYMEDVYYAFEPRCDSSQVEVLIQGRGMDEGEKEAFIGAFHVERDKTLISFVVLGGMFGEGIDLVGEKLSGAIIISVGLPQLGYERDLIKRHFEQISGIGFEYAYVFPGMNKVMQSAGRVIRTPSDRGVVVLIDERFNRPYYSQLFPDEWSSPKVLLKGDSITDIICDFWGEK